MFPPFLTNFLASVFALSSAHMGPLVTAVAALIVVADAVVKIRKGNVGWLMTLVFAVKAW